MPQGIDYAALARQHGGSVVSDPPVDRGQGDRRADGSAKGDGFLGVLQRPDGKVSSEISIGVNIDGKEVEIPTLVPTLTPQERQWLLNNDISDPKKIPPAIIQKAVDYARPRIRAGQSPFADTSESPSGTKPDAMEIMRSLSSMQTPLAMRSHGDPPPATTARLTAGTSTARVPPEQLRAAFRSRMLAAPGNIADAYIENGPMRAIHGLHELLVEGNYAKGAHEVINGAGVTALPLAAPAIAAASPLATLSAFIFGAGGKFAAERIASSFGATDDQAALAGDIGGLGAGALSAKATGALRGAGTTVREAAGGPVAQKALREFVDSLPGGKAARTIVGSMRGAPDRPPTMAELALRAARGDKDAIAAMAILKPGRAPRVEPSAPVAAAPPPAAAPAPSAGTPRRASPSSPAALVRPPATAGGKTLDEVALTELTARPPTKAEVSAATKWKDRGMPDEQILLEIYRSRRLTAAMGTPTPDEAAKAVDRSIYESTTPRGARSRSQEP